LSDMFPIMNGLKQGENLLPLLFSFVLEYAIRSIQLNQDGLKLKVNTSFWYADDVRVHITERNMKVLVVASKEVGLEVNCDKTKYMVLSQDMNENEVTI